MSEFKIIGALQWNHCEAPGCNNAFIAGYGYSCALSWLVTGHARIAGFMCQEAKGGQHWGCSPLHAVEAMLQCLNNHMSHDILMNMHDAIEGPRYSSEDEKWAASRGKEFHIIRDRTDLHSVVDAMIDWED